VLFHVTIGHDARDCPGRRPTDPPGLIAPSDTREALGVQLGVKMHFVLWSAACMLWAQPEHLAFAVLEAGDVESALQYVAALVPDNWTRELLPVWNLPSQLRLIRQVQLAPTLVVGDALSQAEPNAHATPEQAPRPAPTPETADSPRTDTGSSSAGTGSSARDTWPQTKSDSNSPGTITRLLHDLEAPSAEGAEPEPATGGRRPSTLEDPAAEMATQIEPYSHPPVPQVRAWLVATSGPTKGRTFFIPVEGATVGRLPENDIYVADERLSREHARIECKDGTFYLSDLGSRNGTALNGSLLSDPQPLTSGDTIELGSNTFIVTIEANSAIREE